MIVLRRKSKKDYEGKFFLLKQISNNQYFCQMHNNVHFLIIFASFLVHLHQSVGVPKGFSANYKYTLTGKYVINIADQILSTNSTVWSLEGPTSVTIAYPDSVYDTNVLVDVILGDFEWINLQFGISVTLYLLSANNTHMEINILSNNASNIKKLTIVYAIFNNHPGVYGNVAAYHRAFIINKTISNNPASTHSILLPLPTTINETGGVSVCIALAGIDIYPTDPLTSTMDITNSGVIIDKSTLQLTISSKSASPTYVLSISYIAVLYNSGYLSSSASNFVRLWSNVIQLPVSGSFTFTSPAFQIADFNTYIGILSFSVSNQNSFNFFTEFSSIDSSFTITSTTVFKYASFSYLIIYINYCDYKTPFLEIQTQLCYDICPSSYASNNVTLQCNYLSSNPVGSQSQQSFPAWGIAMAVIIPIMVIAATIFFCVIYKDKPKNGFPKIKEIVQIRFNEQSDTNKPNLDSQTLFKYRARIHQSQQHLKQEYSQKYTHECDGRQPPRVVPIELPQHRIIPDDKKNDASIEQPIHHPLRQPQTQGKQIKQEWMEDYVSHEQSCCICLKERPFLRGSCSHEFHLTCLLLWRQKKSHCPLCRENIDKIAKFYCKICGKFYKNIDLEVVNPESVSFKVVCNNCPI